MAATDPLRLRYSASVLVVGFGQEARELLDQVDPDGVEGADWVVVEEDADTNLGDGADILILAAHESATDAHAAPRIGDRASRRGALVAGIVVKDDPGRSWSATGCLEDLRDAVDVLIVGDQSAFVSYLRALRCRS
jgi:cell division GTPase FtsZ